MFFSKFIDYNTIHSCILTAILFMIPLKKRDHFPLRLLSGVLLGILLNPSIILFQHVTIGLSIAHPHLTFQTFFKIALNTISNLSVYLLFLTIYFFACCSIHLLPAIYCAACAYLTQDLAYTIFAAIMPSAAHRGSHSWNPGTFWLEFCIVLIINFIFYFLLTKHLLSQACTGSQCLFPLLYALVIVIIGRILGTYSNIWLKSDTYNMFRIILFYDILLTFTLLAAQILIFREYRFQHELTLESSLRQTQYQQFQSYQKTVDNLRHKCHDLKHIIFALEADEKIPESASYFQDIRKSILDFDSTLNTGNATLDTLLGNICGICEQRQIQWTCIADGTLVDFVNAFDLYLMLGNALDNALECVSSIQETEKRFLSVHIQRRNQMVIILIKNYCDHPLDFHNGLPVTNKDNPKEHGYGMKTIQSIAEKYNGNLSIHLEDEIFTLAILLTHVS